jgi:hypothetical protein
MNGAAGRDLLERILLNADAILHREDFGDSFVVDDKQGVLP